MSATATQHTTFGGHLRQRRNAIGRSQQEVADQIGVTKPAYQQWEWDDTLPESGRIPLLAKALNVKASTVGRWLEDSPLQITHDLGVWLRSLLQPAT